ncbi:phage terminase large subunit family protein [Candidatus Pacearchaeota archaeon]|nr:phage terminase large subunit family protein [Candidatus Pacearchaeota archaeon]
MKKLTKIFKKKYLTHDLDYHYDRIDELPESKVLSNIIECAEKHRRFPENSPFPGKMKYKKTPYMIEIAEELSPQSDTEEVVIMKCGQGGATACATEPLILFKIMEDPGPVLAITANEQLAKTWEEDRLEPMFSNSGANKRFRSTTKKNSQHGGNGSASLKKTWPGGRLDVKTYGKVSQIRQISYSHIILEEEEEAANAAQRGAKQGKFRDIAYARTRAFRGRRKILRVSTPLMFETSEIYPAFMAGDQRYFYVPCPDCGHMQHLEWKNLKFTKNEHEIVIPESVYYQCAEKKCDYKIKNEDKSKMLQLGEWRPHNKDKARPKTKSYTFNALYVPPGMDTFADLAQQWVDAQKDPEKLQVFINLNLAQPFRDYSDAPPAESLHVLKGSYKRGALPGHDEGGIIYSMIGADVQHGNKRGGEWLPGKEPRIEASLWGFGLNGRSWLIDHYIIKGPVNDWRSGAYAKFREMIVNKEFPIMPVKIFIDSRYETDSVRRFCSGSNNIFPIMGVDTIKHGYFRKVDLQGYTSGDGGPLPMYELSTNSLKRRLYNNLLARRDPLSGKYPYGFTMFPVDLEHRFFEQLTSERPEPIEKNGKIRGYAWVSHGANETLDCRVYADEAREVFMFEVCEMYGYEATNIKFFDKFALDKFGFQYPEPIKKVV